MEDPTNARQVTADPAVAEAALIDFRQAWQQRRSAPTYPNDSEVSPATRKELQHALELQARKDRHLKTERKKLLGCSSWPQEWDLMELWLLFGIHSTKWRFLEALRKLYTETGADAESVMGELRLAAKERKQGASKGSKGVSRTDEWVPHDARIARERLQDREQDTAESGCDDGLNGRQDGAESREDGRDAAIPEMDAAEEEDGHGEDDSNAILFDTADDADQSLNNSAYQARTLRADANGEVSFHDATRTNPPNDVSHSFCTTTTIAAPTSALRTPRGAQHCGPDATPIDAGAVLTQRAAAASISSDAQSYAADMTPTPTERPAHGQQAYFTERRASEYEKQAVDRAAKRRKIGRDTPIVSIRLQSATEVRQAISRTFYMLTPGDDGLLAEYNPDEALVLHDVHCVESTSDVDTNGDEEELKLGGTFIYVLVEAMIMSPLQGNGQDDSSSSTDCVERRWVLCTHDIGSQEVTIIGMDIVNQHCADNLLDLFHRYLPPLLAPKQDIRALCTPIEDASSGSDLLLRLAALALTKMSRPHGSPSLSPDSTAWDESSRSLWTNVFQVCSAAAVISSPTDVPKMAQLGPITNLPPTAVMYAEPHLQSLMQARIQYEALLGQYNYTAALQGLLGSLRQLTAAACQSAQRADAVRNRLEKELEELKTSEDITMNMSMQKLIARRVKHLGQQLTSLARFTEIKDAGGLSHSRSTHLKVFKAYLTALCNDVEERRQNEQRKKNRIDRETMNIIDSIAAMCSS